MRRILVIDSSPRLSQSASSRLAHHFVETWRRRRPGDAVQHRHVGALPPPHLDEETIGAFFTPPADLTPEQKAALVLSDELIAELEAADVIVIGAPMFNFSITSNLKAWIDHVARAGRTFRYTESGPEGLLTDKAVFVLTARGGDYSEGSPAAPMDLQAPYLRTVLGFLGLTDITFIHAQGLARGGEVAEAAIADSQREIEGAVSSHMQRLAA